MKRLLVTNDDGIDSPALLPLLRALSHLGEVEAVVPDRERSWIGKAMTRREPVEVKAQSSAGGREFGDFRVYTCTGTPGDCTNLAIHHVLDQAPDLVVSGINVGLNHGDAFASSSGTLAAAVEARLSGVTAVAFSIGSYPLDSSWQSRARKPEAAAVWERAAAVAADIVDALLREGLPTEVDLLNVNMPETVTRSTRRCITSLSRMTYGSLFDASETGSETSYVGGFPNLRERGQDPARFADNTEASQLINEHTALAEGSVAMTPLQWIRTAPLSPDLSRALGES